MDACLASKASLFRISSAEMHTSVVQDENGFGSAALGANGLSKEIKRFLFLTSSDDCSSLCLSHGQNVHALIR